MTKSCCLTCEHCEAVDKDDDMILCCMLCGEEDAVPVHHEHLCSAYTESEMADCFFSSVLDEEEFRRAV